MQKFSRWAATLAALTLFSACSGHHAPNEDGIKSALLEKNIKADKVEIVKCERHNDLESEGGDSKFDWYSCAIKVTITDKSGKTGVIEANEILTFNPDGWHLT